MSRSCMCFALIVLDVSCALRTTVAHTSLRCRGIVTIAGVWYRYALFRTARGQVGQSTWVMAGAVDVGPRVRSVAVFRVGQRCLRLNTVEVGQWTQR